MAAFTYDAINAQGLRLSGEIHAADLIAAREQLRARGLLPQALKERPASGEGGKARFKKVKPKSLQVFSRQLATMIEAGVSVVQAFATLEQQTDDKYLRQVIARDPLRRRGRHGPLEGVRAAPEGLQPAVRGDDRGGRVVGNARHRARPHRDPDREGDALKRRVKSAMVYPLVVLTFATLVLIFMLMFIVPVFQKVFDDLGGELPTPTQIIVEHVERRCAR